MQRRLLRALARLGGAVPMPIWEIAEAAGWRVEFQPGLAPECLGFAVIAPPVALAVIDEVSSEATRRYTLAHEMGHVLEAHESRLILCTGRGRMNPFVSWMTSREERDADVLAARILIPEAALDAEDWNGVALTCCVPTWLVELRLRDCLGKIGSGSTRSGRWATDSWPTS